MRVRNHIVEAGDDQPNPRNNDAENNGADGDDGEGIHGNLHVAVSMHVTVSIGSLQSYSTEGAPTSRCRKPVAVLHDRPPVQRSSTRTWVLFSVRATSVIELGVLATITAQQNASCYEHISRAVVLSLLFR
jgi:hypothetical protein